MTYEIETRCQHSRGSSSGFGGPDMYLVVLAVPDGAVIPRYLNHSVLERRGIKIIYHAEYYSRHGAKRGMAAKAFANAREIIATMEGQSIVKITPSGKFAEVQWRDRS